MAELTAVGITCGVGSMLIGAKQLGFEVVGNIEWRSYYHATDERGLNTFTENFKGAPFVRSIKADAVSSRMYGATLAMSHPECGAYSTLSGNQKRLDSKSDIPLALELIRELKPRFFAMDELPKALIAMPMEELMESLPGYDLFPEWVSNYNYGNVQKARNRFFLIGARRGEGFTFVPGEEPSEQTLQDVLQGLEGLPNNDPQATKGIARYARHVRFHGAYPTHEEAQEFLAAHKRGTIYYHNAEGRITPRMSLPKSAWDKPCPVLTGLNPALHPSGRPFNVRERARIQGVPDDFVFYGTKLEGNGTFDHCRNATMAKQTGKFMPVQFCTYVARQVKAHVQGKRFKSSGQRVVKPNPFVTQAKMDWCAATWYEDQKRACSHCWVEPCKMRQAPKGSIP